MQSRYHYIVQDPLFQQGIAIRAFLFHMGDAAIFPRDLSAT